MITVQEIVKDWIEKSAIDGKGISEIIEGHAACVQLVDDTWELYTLYGSPFLTTDDADKALRMIGL